MSPATRYQWNSSEELHNDSYPSRSQKKRDSTALQKIGEELAALSPSQIASIPLSDSLRKAILEWQHITSHEGRRRQMQYIGRLMREEGDADVIRTALDKIKAGYSEEILSLKKVEQLRDKLMLASPTELDALLAQLPVEEHNILRDLISRAREERKHKHPPHAFRALFRRLRIASTT